MPEDSHVICQVMMLWGFVPEDSHVICQVMMLWWRMSFGIWMQTHEM